MPCAIGLRWALEDAVKIAGYEYQSDFARKYYGEGKADGRAEEAGRIVLRQLARRVGMLGPELQARVEALDLPTLESLLDDLLDFTAVADLEAWLDRHRG